MQITKPYLSRRFKSTTACILGDYLKELSSESLFDIIYGDKKKKKKSFYKKYQNVWSSNNNL